MTPSDARLLSELVAAEIGEPPAETNENRVTDPSRDLTGLSLSGGGIRSATFNLGLLQGLHHFRLLDRLDYLSTVSGGGYVGSFWSAWRSRKENAGRTFPDASGAAHRGEAAEVRHLREFSSFLAPRLGVLSWDTGRILVSMLSAAVPSLLTALSVIALGVLGWLGSAYGIFATDRVPSTVAFVGVTAVLLIVAELMWRRRGEENDRFAYVGAAIWGLLSTGGVWWLIRVGVLDVDNGPDWYRAGQTLPIDPGGSTSIEWQLYLMAPVAAWGAVIMAFALRRWLTSTYVKAHSGRVYRNSFDRVHARLILLVAIWIVVAGLWIAGVELWEYAQAGREVGVAAGTGGAIGALLWAFVDLQKRLSAKLSSDSRPSLLARLRPFAPQLVAYAAIALMVVGVVVLIVAFEQSDTSLRPTPVWFGVFAATIVILALARLNANEIGLHTFYRARLSRAYLGASNPDGEARGMTEERKDDDIKLDALTIEAPCHLICCAANDLANRELGNLHRGARSAVLSRAGFTVDERVRWWTAEAPAPTVSAAVTASAAAFNTLMGGKSKKLGPAVTFLMAALNLRLGLWLPRVTAPGLWGIVERRLHGLPFLKEMFGLANAEGRHVHLSDGGHFENMALYELIRRHCLFIIASDCGMDPTISFDDIGNLVRRVRSDFGVDIQIDLEPLRPDENGFARQSMVAGDIHYPEGDTGILLLFKPALTGTEPADVAQYQKRNPAFPHESTVDQFYNEAQWESYRRLGEHAAHEAFARIVADLDRSAADYPARLFGRARREGQPVPTGFGDRLSHFADRIAELDTMLREPDCATLLREVYKEFDAIDRDGAGPSVRAFRTVGEGRTEAQGSGGEVDRRLPAPADLAPSLHLIRRVLLLMQELYTRDRLEENYNHPLYLGTINYFARWTSAPLFRMWWPILKTMYPQPFTRFVERVYGLRARGGDGYSVVGTVGDFARSIEGFAMTCWMQEGRHDLAEGQQFLPFTMTLTYHGVEHHLQAAQIVLNRIGTDLAWDSHDFYVPPGLWGAGIGESFLGRLLERVRPGGETSRLFVRIAASADTEHAARKQIANERQLYRGVGFTQIGVDAVPGEVRERLATVDEGRQAGGGPGAVERWMAYLPPEAGIGPGARDVAIAR